MRPNSPVLARGKAKVNAWSGLRPPKIHAKKRMKDLKTKAASANPTPMNTEFKKSMGVNVIVVFSLTRYGKDATKPTNAKMK